MKDLGITKGEWIVDKTTVYSLYQVGWDKGKPLMSNRFYLQVYPDYRVENCEVEAVFNAKLIADAGNTAQKCGLLPSELLAQRDELISVINSFIRDFEGDYVMRDGSIVDNPSNILLTNYKLLKNTINKVTE